MQDLRNLRVWERSHALALAAYRATADFPVEERFGLTSQIRRSCASIPANIAEGCGKSNDADFARFVGIAMGSASEFEYHILLAYDLGFLEEGTHKSLQGQVVEVKQMLAAFLRKLRADS